MLSAPAPSRRAGFTLVELVIALVLVSAVAGAIVRLLVRQQRFYTSTTDLIQTRQQIRQAAAMLPSDLRGISSVGGDIYAMSDSSLEFRSVFGSSIVCANSAGKLSTVPRTLAKGSAMTNWAALPSVGDSLIVYNDSTSPTGSNGVWVRMQITAVTAVTGNVASGCPTTSALVQASDLTTSNPSYQLTLSPAASSKIIVGAAMRFFRRVHYSIYQAADGSWYLGFYNCQTGRVPVCNTIQPLAGPFQPYDKNSTTSGVQFAYYDSTGAAMNAPSQVARISLIVRGQSTGLLNLTGDGAVQFRDSLRMEVGLRNRK
jgi:prepilin-type N-terminal cleavage/methylation domain-containing protein